MGLTGSSTTTMRFEGVRIPAERLLGSEGDGLRIALAGLDSGRLGIAAVAPGPVAGRQQLVQQVAVAALHVDEPEAGLPGQLGRAHEVGAEAIEFAVGEHRRIGSVAEGDVLERDLALWRGRLDGVGPLVNDVVGHKDLLDALEGDGGLRDRAREASTTSERR